MPETIMQDEVVAERTATRAHNVRPTINETVPVTGGAATRVDRSGIEADAINEGNRRGRVFKESTEKLLASLEKPAAERAPAPHEVGDADEDEPAEGATEEAPAEEATPAEGEAAPEGETKDEKPDPTEEIRATAERLEQHNRALLSELEAARKTPKAQRTERETTLLAAEQSYIDEGSVPALRKFLSVVVGAAPDSKEVDAELAGLYLDLTSREVGVALDQNQQALRDNARTRLLLARDKREKADAGKKAEPGNGAEEAVQYEQAAKYVDNLLTSKGDSGSSIADEHPLLMSLAEDLDGFKPSEVLARAVRQEYMTGTLDPKGSEIDHIRTVARKIESYYDGVAKKIEAARAKKNPKTDTTKPSVQPKVASEPSKEQRQSAGARTITNATASRAPATAPKSTTQKATTTAEKARKDFKTDAEWRTYLLNKHFGA